MTIETKRRHRQVLRRAVLPATLMSLFMGVEGNVNAFEIDTGNSDLSVRWDNTVRYNVGVRAQNQDSKLLNNTNYDDSDSKFGKGDVVTDRVDLFSEFDAVYKKKFGFRVSGSAWYDNAYSSSADKSNPAFNVPGLGNVSTAYPNSSYTNYVKRWNEGPSGQLLDAFVFGRFDLGEKAVDVRFGRHTVYWGESLFSFVDGVSAGQGPVDVRKALTTPGAEAKELFLPLSQLSGQIQLTDTLTLAGQYFFQWAPSPIPDGGTYLGGPDFLTNGGGTYVINPAAAAATGAQLGLPPGVIAPVPFVGIPNRPKNAGDWGIKAAWAPEWLDGTMGFYYREYTDKLPEVVLGGFQPGLPIPSSVEFTYPGRTKLYGISLSKSVAGVSIGSDLSYRENENLRMGGATVAGSEPRGNTFHGLINAIVALPRNALYDSAPLAAELTWSHLVKVTENANNYSGIGYGGCPTQNKWDGCATPNAIGLAMSFTPTWYHVANGVDISMPLVYRIGLKGNSPYLYGGNQGDGAYSIGLSAAVKNQYTLSLAYNGYLVRSKNNGVAVTSVNSAGDDISDRGWVSLTLKATF